MFNFWKEKNIKDFILYLISYENFKFDNVKIWLRM